MRKVAFESGHFFTAVETLIVESTYSYSTFQELAAVDDACKTCFHFQVEQGAPGLPVISHPLGIVRLSNFLLQAFVRLGGKFRNKFKNLPLIVVVR